ncbi:MAG: HAD-IA family hydrolase [Beijerinckiaceae bacterium]|nr:HAD-IA family hydrolase [Beijerinckiaceae bacterium]MCZ8299535.1 HAD-IA family hydrolase [Beijerinckiaceae bacterium]
MTQLLLFDVDGTLVNSEAIILTAQAQTFAAVGLPAPSRERGLSIVGLSLHEAFTVLVGSGGPVEALVAAYREVFHALRKAGTIPEPLYPGAASLLAGAGADPRFRLGIATGKSRRGVAALLDAHGWHDLMATIQTADDAPSKPHPGMILQASAATGIPLGETVMIGDSVFDMQMARAAGARAIGVAWGFQPVEALREAGAEVIAHNFDDLARILRLPG